MILHTHAKINLTLAVTGRRTDGYHDVDTIYQPITLGDTLELEKKDSPGLDFSCPEGAPEDENNLVCRAYRLLAEHFPALGGVRAVLGKTVPSEAGLGGGSGDAAAMLAGCARLYSLPCGTEELARLGAFLGADVPALLYPGASRGRGTGTELSPIASKLVLPLLILKPPVAFSTPAMYRRLDAIGRRSSASASDSMETALKNGSREAVTAALMNDFEQVVCEPEALAGKKLLREAGASAVLLSGSGSAWFGIFRGEAERDAAYSLLLQKREALPPESRFLLFRAETVNE